MQSQACKSGGRTVDGNGISSSSHHRRVAIGCQLQDMIPRFAVPTALVTSRTQASTTGHRVASARILAAP